VRQAPITFYIFWQLLYLIEHSGHFFTCKMILKYSLRTIHGRSLEKGLRCLVWWINFQWLILVKLFSKKNSDKNYYEFQVHTILVCALYSIKYRKCYSSFTNVTIMKLLLFPSFQFYFVYLYSGAQHMH
jgi:hypothetical protein